MNSYEYLIDECYKQGVKVIEKKFKSKAKGLWKNNKIGISNDISTNTEKLCVLAEEYAHYLTSSGNILDLSDISNLKQENEARSYAYEKLCSIPKIVHAIRNGANNKYEIAEYLNVTDNFLADAIKHHKCKHGLFYKHEDILISFEPTFMICEA